MAFIFTVLRALIILSFIIALAAPYLVMRSQASYSDAVVVSAQRNIFSGVIVLLIGGCAALGLSFSNHACNVIAVTFAAACGGMLVVFPFDLKRKILARPVGVLATVGWLLLLLVLGGGLLFDGHSPATARLDDDTQCRETVYGFVTGDSGEELGIYKRYFFIDKRIAQRSHSDVAPVTPDREPANIEELLLKCQAAVNNERTSKFVK